MQFGAARVLGVTAIVAVLTLAWAVAAGPPASAHTALVASVPDVGQAVGDLKAVRLEFSGELLEIGASIDVIDDAGSSTSLEVTFPEPRVAQAAAPPLTPGSYVIEWRVVSQDGHPIEGDIEFEVSEPQVGEPSPTALAGSEGTARPVPAASASPASGLSSTPSVSPGPGEELPVSVGPLAASVYALVATSLVVGGWLLARRIGARRRDVLKS